MTKEEYNKKFEDINKEFKKAVAALNAECSKENNKYKVGDIIADHIGKGRITEIVFNCSDSVYRRDLPTCLYWVENLTKSGTINKREPYRRIWEINIV